MSFTSNEFEIVSRPTPSTSLLNISLRVLFSLIWKSSIACYFYFLGFQQWSLVWVALPLLGSMFLEVFKSRASLKRRLNQVRARVDEKEWVSTHFKELPAWVFFPDIERTEWLNKIMKQMWPTVNNFTRSYIQDDLEPQIRKNLESYMLKGFQFQRIELGSISPKFTGVKVYDNTGRNEIIIDLYIFYGGDCVFTFSVKGMSGGIQHFQLEGMMRIILKPLIPTLPIIGGIKCFFIDNPDIDFEMTGVAGLLEIPGIRAHFRNSIESTVNSMMVLPNMLVFNMSDQAEVISYLRTPKPKGVLRVHVLEGKNLISQDLNGLSDPFVIVNVGSQQYQSATINYTLNPIWSFHCEFIITELQGQKVVFHVWDEDYGKDDPLGKTSFDISQMKNVKYVDTWLILEEVAHGSIHIEVIWFDLTKSLQVLEETLDENHLLEGVSVSSAVLTIFVESASDLPRKTGMPSPLVQLKVGSKIVQTQECLKTANPTWDEGFCLLVQNPHNNILELKVIDSVTKKQLGYLEFKIQQLLQRKNMKIQKQPYKLLKSGDMSQIVISTSLRIMTINDVTVSPISFILSSYKLLLESGISKKSKRIVGFLLGFGSRILATRKS